MRRIILLVCAVLIASCSSPTESSFRQVEFTVEPLQVVIGDSITATLSNRSAVTIEYSFCPRALKQRTNAGWLIAQQPFGVPLIPRTACVGVAYQLAPGESAQYRQVITEDVEAGRYRLRMDVWSDEGSRPVLSTEFQVVTE